MIYGILSRVARVRFTVGYVAILAAVSSAILLAWIHTPVNWSSCSMVGTNLHNLAHGRLGTLLGSAFVVDAGPVYFWMPFLTCCLLALAELHSQPSGLMVELRRRPHRRDAGGRRRPRGRGGVRLAAVVDHPGQ